MAARGRERRRRRRSPSPLLPPSPLPPPPPGVTRDSSCSNFASPAMEESGTTLLKRRRDEQGPSARKRRTAGAEYKPVKGGDGAHFTCCGDKAPKAKQNCGQIKQNADNTCKRRNKRRSKCSAGIECPVNNLKDELAHLRVEEFEESINLPRIAVSSAIDLKGEGRRNTTDVHCETRTQNACEHASDTGIETGTFTCHREDHINTDVIIEIQTFDILQLLNIEEKLKIQFPNISLYIDKEKSSVMLCGTPDGVNAVEMALKMEISNLKYIHLNVSNMMITFLGGLDMDDFCKSYFHEKHINAKCIIDGQSVIILTTQEHAQMAEDQMKNILREVPFLIPQNSKRATTTPKWRNFIEEIKGTNSTLNGVLSEVFDGVGSCSEVVLVGFDAYVKRVFNMLEHFCNINAYTERHVPVTSLEVIEYLDSITNFSENPIFQNNLQVNKQETGYLISGHPDSVSAVEHYLKNLIVNVFVEKLDISSPGALKIAQKEEKRVHDICQDKNCLLKMGISINKSSLCLGQDLECIKLLSAGRIVYIYTGNILVHCVDAIVNSSNIYLKHIVGLAKAISDAAGPDVQRECDEHIRIWGELTAGDTVVTSAGRLPCKNIIHAVVPCWSEHMKAQRLDSLRKAVASCLEIGEREGYSSVAFPNIGAGMYGIPLGVYSDIVVEVIIHHCNKTKNVENKLKSFHIVDIDQKVSQAFKSAFENNYSFVQPISPIRTMTTKKGMKISIVAGNLEQDVSDVLVNIVDRSMCLNSGVVSKALLKQAGPEMQAMVTLQSQGKDVTDGQIVETDTFGCNLACKKVYHTVLPQVNSKHQTSQVVGKILKSCLAIAGTASFRSISVPVLGMWNLGYDVKSVAESMFSEAVAFSNASDVTTLQEVRFVLNSLKEQTMKVFDAEMDDYPNKSVTMKKRKSARISVALKNKQTAFRRSLGPSFDSGNPVTRSINGVLVEIKHGDIIHETSYAIVNIASETSGRANGITDSIMKAAGWVAEKKSNLLSQIANKPLVVTSGGALHCKHIIHVATPSNPQKLKACVAKVLRICEKRSVPYISFPAIGTGKMGLNPAVVADTMLGAIEQYSESCQKGSALCGVRIVILRKEMLHIFQESLLDWQQSTSLSSLDESPSSVMVTRPRDMNSRFAVHPAHLHIYGKSWQNVSEAAREVTDVIKGNLTCVIVELKDVTLRPKHYRELENMEIRLGVRITAAPTHLSVEGTKDDVSMAKLHILLLLQEAKENNIPVHWDDMGQERFAMVPLVSATPEYKDVADHFNKNGQSNYRIARIERIQNINLWQGYELQKKIITDEIKMDTERLLYHGTSHDVCNNISRNGFDRGYCGKNGWAFGKGTYFAIDPEYSANDLFSVPDATGLKMVFRARVVTGDYCVGVPSLNTRPSKPGQDPSCLYNSSVNCAVDPKIFSIFHDCQAYPEYLITLKS
ncbi:protein mono-ADP-ribosyltransferase PARP14-like isoform X2 [Petromyzon marinus]|uniref:protein mono-ADP-ribosyltransferase PARP14-like isoform X2 n=1 Tax=Petromyzon marinus TaxID=7757 RepID=UPI003F72A6AC